MYSTGNLGTAEGMSALGNQLGLISEGCVIPSFCFINFSVCNPRMTSTNSSLGCNTICGVAVFVIGGVLLLISVVDVGVATVVAEVDLVSFNACCNLAKFLVVTGAVTAENPSSAENVVGALLLLLLVVLLLLAALLLLLLLWLTEKEGDPIMNLVRKEGVGVARRALILPAPGNKLRPLLRLNIPPAPPLLLPLDWCLCLLESVDTAEIVEKVLLLAVSLPASDVVSEAAAPLAVVGVVCCPSVTSPTASSTRLFHALNFFKSSCGCINLKNKVYFRSLLTNIVSNTLLHFLMTSLKLLNVTSSFNAPLVAVSVATSSTSANNYNYITLH
mmetsp:Transcript_22049/g.21193  ORF Transcript_22049/g.21193 Transcript_22049/m.21193 type:complete len:331 (+) Transcript_22049:55-1047(+)